jgi:hypothetical protein
LISSELLSKRATIVHRDELEGAFHPELVETGRVTEVPCYLEPPRRSDEITVDRDTIISDWLGVFAAGTEIGPLDLVVATEGTFQVVGDPSRFHEPAVGDSHVEVRLRRISDEQPEGS